MSYERALPIVLRSEGGFSDHPADRGGRTNHGITQTTYDEWRDSRGLYRNDVRYITADEVRDLYRDRYWIATRCDALPWPVSAAMFDAAVNHGPGRAVRMLQEALLVKVDGVIGPVTLAAAEGADPEALTNEMLWGRLAFYRAISQGDQLVFLRGWISRLLDLRRELGL